MAVGNTSEGFASALSKKRWRFLHAKLAFCYKIVRNSVRPAIFGKRSMQKQNTVRIGYKVTGYSDLSDIVIEVVKIKIKTSKKTYKISI